MILNSDKMPVLFIGHGNPMNAIETNDFTKKWTEIGQTIPKPSAIICISAHWETAGTKVTAMRFPKTIHDFGGFPPALFAVNYPAKGNPELAKSIIENIDNFNLQLDTVAWGLDHGTWSILKHMYPNADIPVIQISLNKNQLPSYHYELAKQLKYLRSKSVLILASGNLVHNLRMVDWRNYENEFDWAIEANNKIKSFISDTDHNSLINFQKQGKSFELAIPTAEHFLPLLYILALQDKKDELAFFNDKTIMGSLSMTSFILE